MWRFKFSAIFFTIFVILLGLTLYFFNARDRGCVNLVGRADSMTNFERKSFEKGNLIPRSVIFGNPDKAGVKISHDGRKISYLSELNGVLNIFVIDTASVVNASSQHDLSKASEVAKSDISGASALNNVNDKDAAAKDVASAAFDSNSGAERGARAITKSTKRGIASYFWMHDNKHIGYFLDADGDENFGLYIVDSDSGEVVKSIVKRGVKINLLGVSPHFPTAILIGINERRSDLFDVYALDIATNKQELLYQNDKYFGFVVDRFFKIRLGGRYSENMELIFEHIEVAKYLSEMNCAAENIGAEGMVGGESAFAADHGTAHLERNEASYAEKREVDGNGCGETENKDGAIFIKFAPNDIDTSSVAGFNASGDAVYVYDSTDRDKLAIFRFDLKRGSKELIYGHDLTDDISLIFTPQSGEPQAIVHEYAKMRYAFIEPAFKRSVTSLQNVLGEDVALISRNMNDDKWIVAVISDDAPPQYYFYNRAKAECGANDSAEVTNDMIRDNLYDLFCGRSAMLKFKLNKMHPVIIEARDGLKLLSYLTLPHDINAEFAVDAKTGIEEIVSVNSSHKVPTILLVHGGPTARDEWGLNNQHQWLANRGYAVLSVNYRGSTGFGKEFIRAGDGEWGRKMHYDLIDATTWAKQMFADDVAIMGGSYGGYAALLGLTITPEDFICGIDIVGPSNLVTLLETVPPYWKPLKISLTRKIGADTSTQEGKEFLASRSPITYVEHIKRPLLIAQGANDPRVKISESEQIVNAMTVAKIPVTYVVYPDEGHGFNRPENRISFYAAAEKFLYAAFHGRAKFEDGDADVKGSSMQVVCGREYIE